MKSDLIFVALSTFAERDRAPLDLVEASGRPFRIHATGKRITTSELLANARDAAVIVAGVEDYSDDTLSSLTNLCCISRCGVGTDSIDLAAAKTRGITILNTPHVPTAAVAELAVTMFLALSRRLLPQADLMRARKWERVEAHLLGARTVGLVGLGRIGRRVAELCRCFSARVIATDPFAEAGSAREAGIDLVSLGELLDSADIVSLHAGRAATDPLWIGEEELRRMKPGSILVNLARGTMVDEAALIEALRSGHLAGAGLDVFSEEPYRGALCDMPQVILTPHSATLPVETRVAMEVECVEKALRFLDGQLGPDERVI